MRDNKSFCVLPFIHIAADPSGVVKPCCTSQDVIRKSSGEAYNLGYDSIADIFNSTDFLEIRRKMTEGELVSGCSECYEQEQHSGFSQRINWNSKFAGHTDTQIEQTIANDYTSDLQVRYIDLRLGNMCNLKCRSCDTVNSSQLEREVKTIMFSDSKITEYLPLRSVNDEWYKTSRFAANLFSIRDSIYVVYMTGGEPTLIPENIEYLQSIVDNNRAHEVIVTINTNLTNAKPEFLSILSKFAQVIVYASIDGYGDMQNYLRAPSTYEQVRKNLLAFAKLPNVQIEVSPVVQATNINVITDLFDDLLTIDSRNIKIYPIVLLNPRHLSLSILPTEFKQLCLDRLITWFAQFQTISPEFDARFKQAVSMLQDPENTEQLAKFREFTHILDKHRQTNLSAVNPELAAAIYYDK